MSFITTLLSPFNLLFFIMIAGFAIGKIKIYRISLGIAGVLFVSIFVGFLMNHIIPMEYHDMISDTQSTMKIVSKLGTSLFVSVIGIQTGFSIKNNSKTSFISFFIGCVMSISGVVAMVILSALDQTISHSTFLGILCGALTSTPGLSSVCELIYANGEEAVWGYGCSYLLGVVLVVLFVQLLNPQAANRMNTPAYKRAVTRQTFSEFLLICLAAWLGNILGSISIPRFSISLGSTASTLLIGLFTGYIMQKRFPSIQVSSQVFNTLRNLGLAFFFVGTGYSTGVQSVNFNVRTILYGAFITLTAILCGLLMCKVVFARHQLNIGCVISGGMTSSPAYGTISHQVAETMTNHFSFAYFGSLLSLVIAIQIIGR